MFKGRRKCECCGHKPTSAKKVFKKLTKFRDGSTLGTPGELGMGSIKAPAGGKDIRICVMCWGEVMKEFGRMVRDTYIPDPFYNVARAIINARKEAFKK